MAKYLYNGFSLPVLPAYDAAAFPYAIIVSADGENTSFILLLCANRPYYGTNPEDSTKTGVYNTGLKKVYTCAKEDSAWAFSMDNENPLTANDDDPGGGIIWTNPDILKTDGSVWMAGTQPVPERVSEAWVRSFKEGLALGLVGAPLPYTGKAEPVAYLYNGERFPKIPVVEGYNYAAIEYMDGEGVVSGGRAARLILSTEPIWTHNGYLSSFKLLGDIMYYGFANDENIWRFTFGMTAPYPPINQWVKLGEEQYSERTAVSDIATAFAPIWANHDVYYEGFSFYYPAKSDPIPVYE